MMTKKTPMKLKLFKSFFALILLSAPVFAQDVAKAPSSGNYFMNTLIVVFLAVAVMLLLFSLVLLNAFKVLSKEMINPTIMTPAVKVTALDYEVWAGLKKDKPSIMDKLLGLKPIEEEKDMMLEHEFDGIRELNNPVPGWFNFLFYGSIAFGIMYFVTYHVTGWGMLQEEEYVVEMKQADKEKKIYLAKSANNIDESSVKVSSEASIISAGMAVYKANCVACHGEKGQGTVGPNLTDEFWIHGGKIDYVFKTIKYGIPEKGMMSWEKVISPKQISEVSNYILSIKGTDPVNPKTPQGDKEVI